MNLPNKLTILRICMIPFFIACFYLPFDFSVYIAAAVFAIAYATDALDGHLARKNGQVTDFGKLMDPIADKLLSAAALIMLTAMDMIHPVAVIVILSREFLISGLRLVCADKGVVVAASAWGKLKTISQVVCIMAVMAVYPLGIDWLKIAADVTVWISVALALISGVDYLIKNRSCISTK
ncbi:MAG: CDP-diacylglycerol--glycerol-3-phosphate 3-phosphatidyltransferase [Clostridia bacterium]|nr:CDP-diacylglycerol--glycerol-3-phosphate 3-phosphatidyltransferase [Clostridia bacterium]